jgi:ribonuclease BN (tRNA processing enzyme)
MELEVLGFRVGAPLGAACSSYVVRDPSAIILLDCGPGALERLWQRGLAERLDAIVISHMHIDHMLDLVPFSGEVTEEALQERRPERRLPRLYVPRANGLDVLDGLSDALAYDPARFRHAFDLREYDESDVLEVGTLRLTFARMSHGGPCYATRVDDGASSIVYGADGAWSDALVSHAEGADLLLLEATYWEPGPHLDDYGHMTGEQAGELAHRAGARRLVLVHTAPFPDGNAESLRRARDRFGGPVELAAEGAVYSTRG